MPATFRLRVMSLVRSLYDGQVESVYLTGDEGEYELLPYHYPLLGALPKGFIKIAKEDPISLASGVIMFDNNNCLVLIQEVDTHKLLYGTDPETDPKKKEG